MISGGGFSGVRGTCCPVPDNPVIGGIVVKREAVLILVADHTVLDILMQSNEPLLITVSSFDA